MRELWQVASQLFLPDYAARQMAGCLYGKRCVSTIDEMTSLPAKIRTIAAEDFCVGLRAPVSVQTSVDGTRKYLFPALADQYVEAAYIPDSERATLCMSTQVGCRMGCAFCMTARQGWQGNLSATDMLNQFRSLPERDSLTNIVMMGMGEPFDNLDELMKVLEVLTSDYGYGWAPKRITVSTVGILPAVHQFMAHCRCHLAVSLHHPDPAERQRLVPAERKYPVHQLVALLKNYDLNRQRRISFEYVMLAGVNDSLQQADDVVRLLSGLRCRVNLIRFHPVPGSAFVPSSDETIQMFADALQKKGLIATVRRSRGIDIQAACGLLSTRGRALPA